VSRWHVPWTAALWCAAVLGVVFTANIQAAETFRYSVKRDKLPRDERGELQVDATGLHYRSENGKNSIRVAFGDIHKADLSDPRVIRIETYDILKRKLTGRREYVFRLTEGKFDEALTMFFVAHSKRPVIGSYAISGVEPTEIDAYHRHRLGGCHGKLQITVKGIRFTTAHPADSRTWRYEAIETIGSMYELHFRVATLAETYNFDLKERLPNVTYEKIVRQAYRLP
jgi:hypothetical protein